MARINLTQRAVEALRAPDPSGRQRLHWDSKLTGFGLLVSGKTNAKTFVVQRDVGGKTRRVTIGPTNVFGVEAARRKAEGILADLYSGVDPKAKRGSTTLAEALAAYLVARPGLRPTSVRDYQVSVRLYLAPWSDLPMRSITAEMVEQRHRVIQKQIAAGGRYAGYGSANLALQTLRVLYNFVAEREPGMPPNPVSRLKRQWFPVHRRERLVKADDLPAFHRAILELPNPVQRDYLLLLLYTGLRRSEAASLTWSDVDFSARTLRLPAARSKGGRKLDLPMSDLVFDLLVARRSLGKDRFVFPSSGKGGHISEPKFPLEAIERATGIRASAHDLRRTFATVAAGARIAPIALKMLISHAVGGGDITSGYVILSHEELHEAAQAVADRMKRLCGITVPDGILPLRA
jgi:integrase